MKRMVLALLAMVAAWGANAAVTYRGRLVDMREPQKNLNLGGTKTMTFRFYNDDGVEQSNLELRQEVPLESDGSFTAHLDSDALTTALQKGEATQVGLTVGQATREIQPRRKLLPTASAITAKIAGGLSRKATVGSLTSETLEANAVSVGGNLTVGGAIKPSGAGQRFEQTLGYTAKMADNGGVLALKGPARVFGDVVRLTDGKNKYKAGDFLATAPADGVAAICCIDPIAINRQVGGGGFVVLNGESPNCSIVQFCRKGEDIKVPDSWSWEPEHKPDGSIIEVYLPENTKERPFDVYFYKFLNESGR